MVNRHSIVMAAEEAVTLSGIHSTTQFFDETGTELAGRRELRRFGHLAAAIEQTLTLAPDPTVSDLQNDAARALEQINSRRVRR
jgi:hypothetical protein